MSDGTVISICEYTHFNHSYLVSGSGPIEQVLAGSVPVPAYGFIGASVRVHMRQISSTTPASYQIVVRPTNPSRFDPAEFQSVGIDASTPTITSVANPAAVPGLTALSSPITGIQHPYVKVILRATPPASGTTLLSIILSVDLVCRTP